MLLPSPRIPGLCETVVSVKLSCPQPSRGEGMQDVGATPCGCPVTARSPDNFIGITPLRWWDIPRLPRILVDQVLKRDFLVRRFARLFRRITESDEADRADVGGQLQYLGDFFRIVRANKAGPEPSLGRA